MRSVKSILLFLALALNSQAIQKNVASQKFAVYAYDRGTGLGKTGDAANITAEISLNGGASAATDDTNPTEVDSTDHPGVYVFDLLQAETNTNLILLTPVSSTSNIYLIPERIYPTFATEARLTYLDADQLPTTAIATLAAVQDIALVDGVLGTLADSATITTGSQTNTYAKTLAHNNEYHSITVASSAISFYYEFNVSEAGIPNAYTIHGRLHEGSPPSGGDTIDTYIWDWNNSTWEHVSPPSGDFIGIANSTNTDDETKIGVLFGRHADTDGTVRVKLEGTSLEDSSQMYVDQIFIGYIVIGPTVDEIVDANWLETLADHSGSSGSTAEALAAAESAGDPWITALPGSYTSGQAGFIIGTYLDAAISSVTVIGPGGTAVTYTVTTAGDTPVAGVGVWLTTDIAGDNTVAGTLTTDTFGEVDFLLDSGTYYVWRQKAGYNFTNPKTQVVP